MADDFELDIAKWTGENNDRAKLFVVMFCVNLIRYIQNKTPVLTGRLRASIQTTTPLGDWEPGQDITIGTNVDYARRIEYGFVGKDKLGRLYDQKGVGMFAAAAAIAPQLADLVAKASSDSGAPGPEDLLEGFLEVAELL